MIHCHPIRWFLLLPLLFISAACGAETGQPSDSSDFVKASLLTATPSDVIYSSFGHSAIRMECPSEQLDYCFTLEMDTQPDDYVRFFSGKAKAAVVAVPTKEFLDYYESEGRGMTQHTLNLTLPEEQKLWKILDEENVKPPHLNFNFLNTNCVMMSLLMISNCLIDEHIDYGQLPAYMQLDNGDLIRHYSQDWPWAQFLYITLSGAACDGHYDMEYRLSPQSLVEILQQATIKGDSTASRPVLKETVPLFSQTVAVTPSKSTPTMVFSILLLVVILITLGEWLWGWKKLPFILDVILLCLQTMIGICLIYTSSIANLFGSRWNWYLIPMNPLPLIIWLTLHKKPNFWKIYLAYTIILLLFVAATPLSSQLDLPHQLITLTLVTRTVSHYLKGKKNAKEEIK